MPSLAAPELARSMPMTGSEEGSGLCCCKLLWYNVVDATLGGSRMPCRAAVW